MYSGFEFPLKTIIDGPLPLYNVGLLDWFKMNGVLETGRGSDESI